MDFGVAVALGLVSMLRSVRAAQAAAAAAVSAGAGGGELVAPVLGVIFPVTDGKQRAVTGWTGCG